METKVCLYTCSDTLGNLSFLNLTYAIFLLGTMPFSWSMSEEVAILLSILVEALYFVLIVFPIDYGLSSLLLC